MPDFSYIARDLRGQRITGTLSAASEAEVVAVLSGRSLFPVQVAAEKTGSSSPFRLGGRVKGQVMAMTYSQLAALMRSGVPLLRAIHVIREQTSHPKLKEVLSDVHARVEDGTTLGDAMSRHPRVFSEMTLNMVRAGGEGGFLEDALERVAEFTEQQDDLKSRTAGALAYPLVLATVGSVVVSGLVIFFVPQFAPLFAILRQRGELPMLTEWLLWISNTIRSYGILIALAFTGLFLFLRSWLSTEQGKLTADKLKLRTPMAGSIFLSLAVARFCRVLGTLLHNGVPILKSLEISRGAAGNRVLSAAIAEASENITAGQSLAEPLRSSGHFPATVVEMISVAEESNTLDSVLVQVADNLEKRTARRLDLMVRLLEPIMLLLLALVVLFVVIALLMPVIKMSSTI
ncbi:MAG: type II secretion system F family protein [Planctomycetales bacterium]|nr:type II secretion system F family protein [Planctomycetales bacterium]